MSSTGQALCLFPPMSTHSEHTAWHVVGGGEWLTQEGENSPLCRSHLGWLLQLPLSVKIPSNLIKNINPGAAALENSLQ